MNLTHELRRLALATGFAALGALPAAADIYEWVADDGSVHYTDALEQVPEQYRGGMRVTEDEDSGATQQVPASPAAPAAIPARAASPVDDESIDGMNEAQWRAEAVRLDTLILELAPKAESCEGDHINLSPGDGSRKRREEHAEADACAETEKALKEARADREALAERAHLADVPPGWLRD